MLVEQTRAFLSGRSDAIRAELQAQMQVASEDLAFEQAAAIRDRLKALAHISARQGINVSSIDDADVVALAQDGGQACVQVFFYRGGRNYGNRAYYPSHAQDAGPDELLEAFLGQFYAERIAPPLVLVSHTPASQDLLAEALSLRAQRRVELSRAQRGARRQLVASGRDQRAPRARPKARREQLAGEPPAPPRRPPRPAASRPGASRSTTTATSWGPRRSALSWSPGPRA